MAGASSKPYCQVGGATRVTGAQRVLVYDREVVDEIRREQVAARRRDEKRQELAIAAGRGLRLAVRAGRLAQRGAVLAPPGAAAVRRAVREQLVRRAEEDLRTRRIDARTTPRSPRRPPRVMLTFAPPSGRELRIVWTVKW